VTALIPQRRRGAKSPNDQVFQISLTELAFTIIFLLLLLSGLILNRKDGENRGLVELNNRLSAEREVAVQKLEAAQNAPAILEQLQSSREQLQETLNELRNALSEANVPQKEEIISEWVKRIEQNQEHERLKQKIDDLNVQITALQEIKQQLSDQPGLNDDETANNVRAINAALKFKKVFEDAVKETIDEVHAEEKAHQYIREIALLKESQ
jgi:chromosome segregation ATPase